MGVLTDYFAATPNEAASCATRGPVVTSLPQVALKFVDPAVILGRLWAHIEAVPFSDSHYGNGELLTSGEEGPWLTRIKDGCTAAIAAIPDDRLLPIADQWRAAEEWVGDWDSQGLAGVVVDLRSVARAAVETGRNMYCWMSL